MGVIKKKPYEISVWEDRLVTENDISYYKEIKLAIIGSDKMESPNRVFDPVLIENVNGEKTLTFSLAYKYYDEYKGELVTNPFYPYLINERKIKLFYNDEWNEFVIKECEESSEENIFNYTAKELFSLELAKLGYNVTLDTELNNNQGTIIELAKKVLKDTDWEVDENNSDLLTQYVQEPLYSIELTNDINVLNLDTNELVSVNSGETIYVFYSYIDNKETNFVQFIREADRDNFFIDDDNVIKSTNYRFVQPVEYIYDETTGEVTGIVDVGSLDSLPYLNNQGYRLVYKIQTTYDPVMERTVEIYQMPYKDSIQEIYHFLDYNYATSDIVVSYITNSSNFELFEDGKLQGWYNTTPVSSIEGKAILQPLSTTTYPELSSDAPLELINSLSEITGYIELKFNGTLNGTFENTYFNEGFEHSASIIDHISAGEKFVLRTRYYTAADKHGDLVAGNPTTQNGGLRAIVAKYETIDQECYLNSEVEKPSKIKAYKIIPDDIILQFDEPFVESFNIISNGTFNEDYTQYIIDSVVQTPSSAYIYRTSNDETDYIWNNKIHKYIDKTTIETLPPEEQITFADYYLTTATAKSSLTNEQLSDPTLHLGIFLYTEDDTLVQNYVYLQDIQLTRYYEDANKQVVTLGNIPTAVSNEAHKFYLKPTTQIDSSGINTYGTLDALAAEVGADVNSITPVFNEQSQKVLSIQASQSNYFNILQDLCETFECWLDIRVPHDDTGAIKLDSEFNPIKKVAFKEYAGKDNFAGFKNGINLTGITRHIDSNEIVTKLIVDTVQSQYTDSGSVAIQRAKSNYSGQSYILNFSYYLNRGLITESIEDFNKNIYLYNSQFNELNKDILNLTDEKNQISNSLTKLSAKRNTYTALIDAANIDYNKALADFCKITNYEYEEFVTKYQNLENWAIKEPDKAKDYLNNDTVLDVVTRIYAATVTINNYTGLLANLNQEYEDLYLQFYGAKEYSISVVSKPGNDAELNPSTQVSVDDYISGLQFRLIDSNKSEVVFQTTPNDRIFNASNAVPYEAIEFLQLPSNYRLKYYIGNKSYFANGNRVNIYDIYDNITNETIDKRFVLVPTAEFNEEHKGIQERIDEKIEEKNGLEKDFYKKYSRFLQEGTWSSQDYIDNELYYFDALQVSDTSAQPKVSYTINVLEVSQIDGLENYDFRVGDKTYIEDTDFFGYLTQSTIINDINTLEEGDTPQTIVTRTPVREEVIVSEIEWHFDEPDNNTITIQNYKTRFEDLFQRISATVQTVQRNEITYPKTSSILDQSGLINSNLLADSLNGIGGVGFALTTNGSVAATQDGLLIRDLLNPANVMRLASSGLQVSTDGGVNWGTAISAEGISTDILTAGTINTQQIWLMDGDNPSFRWDKAGLNAYGLDENENESYNLKTYVRFDKYGLYGIKDGEEYVASSIDDIKQVAHFGVTWDGFFIKNSYEEGGSVSITSDNDFMVKKAGDVEKIKIGALEWRDSNGQITTNPENGIGAPTLYGIRILNDAGEEVVKTGDDGNLTMTGVINALAGNFSGTVSVGNPSSNHIIIDGDENNPIISSANYSDGAGSGWLIDGNGDATFSNVSVRGSIKTAVFEYEEIQAVGGAFLFRPSSTIKTARIGDINNGESENDLYVTVEQPLMFQVGSWVKVSNCNTANADPADNLTSYGLVHIYKVKELVYPNYDEDDESDDDDDIVDEEIINDESNEDEDEDTFTPSVQEIVLENAAAILEDVELGDLPGGALIDFGKAADDEHYDDGAHNYGIGVNSSDNYVNLPARAISLFETTIHPNAESKVTYNYRGILGTLPHMDSDTISPIYSAYMEGKQGIYTDNMYIGDKNQYIAFYKDSKGDSQLRLVAKSFEILPDDSDLPIDLGDSVVEQKTQYTLSTSTEKNTVEEEWRDTPYEESSGYYLWQRTYVKYAKGRIQYLPTENGYYMNAGQPGPPGENAAVLVIDSSEGTVFRDNTGTTDLTVTIFYGSQVITNASQMHSIFGNNSYLEWEYKDNTDNWIVLLVNDPRISDDGFTLSVDAEDVYNKANFRCKLII